MIGPTESPLAIHQALLLAAGGSRRLGQPKQLLQQAGQPLVRKMAEYALATRPERLLCVIGAEESPVTSALTGLDPDRLQLCRNPDWQAGLASSLQQAAPLLLQSGLPVLILGCDQLQLSPARLQALLALALAAPERVTVCDYGPASGLPAVLPVTLFERVAELSGDNGLKRFWQHLPQQRLSAPELAFDLDTPAELALARQNGWLDSAD